LPADLRVLEARGLAVQEASLPRKSVPVEKSPEPVPATAVLGDRRSMLWSGTLVTRRTARGLVVATGGATEIGRIGGLIAAVEPLTTPLVAQMDHFARWLSFMVLLCAGLLLVHGHFVGHHDFATRFMVVVGLVGGAWSMSRAPPSACCACAPGSTRRIGTSGPKRWRGAGCGCWRLRAGAGTGIVSIPRRWRGPPPFFNGQFGPPVKD
jgi:hypothetical protein